MRTIELRALHNPAAISGQARPVDIPLALGELRNSPIGHGKPEELVRAIGSAQDIHLGGIIAPLVGIGIIIKVG